jgi:dTDP-4-amino-4,6-dideoxygalactose transaminase
MLARYAGRIAVVMPYATFGYPIDLDRYNAVANKLGVPVVVDGAASLGTFDAQGRGFGTGFSGSVVYSMHATKSFAVGEAGLIYSADPDRLAKLRTMSSFGFGEPRSATMPGLNGKLSEVNALIGRLRLADYDCITTQRAALLNRYRAALPELEFQQVAPGIQAHQFVPALLPASLAGRKQALRTELENRSITTGAYFSPHLLEQPYFRKLCPATPVPVCDEVGARMISLPLYDTMTPQEVDYVVENLRSVISDMEPLMPSHGEHHAPMVYAGVSHAGAQATAK